MKEYRDMSKKGTLYFFTGLAGAGKTTIGGLFYERLKAVSPDAILSDEAQRRLAEAEKYNTVTGDGSDDESYTTEARHFGAVNLFKRCRDWVGSGLDVVCCSIAMYEDIRAWNRANIENYKEIYIRVRMETLYARNQRGLYSPGRKNVVGVDLPWDEPAHADAVVQNDGDEVPEVIVERLWRQLGPGGME